MEVKQKCIIFGAGDRGTRIFKKLSQVFDVIAYADNNSKTWRNRLNGVNIIPPNDLPEIVKETNALIFIANELHYLDISKQLAGMELSFFNCEFNLCYELDSGVWYPVSFGRPEAYIKPDKNKFSVLFVQDKPCTRTNKIAEVLKNRGISTYSAYTASPSDAGDNAYVKEFPFWTYNDLLEFVNESEYDIIHCSNTPDILANLLIHSNKKVIHDCHDIVTVSRKTFHSAEAALEHIVNTQADGVMYTTERMRKIMLRKYGGNYDRTFVLGNYPLSSFGQVRQLPKLSDKDGEIHCAYEGHIVDSTQAKNVVYRFFEPIFIRLAECGIHVHIYSHSVPEYLKKLDTDNPNIHYEGNYSGLELITEMTRYDLGLLMFPLTDTTYLEIASPNKMTECLAAGLPVVTNIQAYADIITKNSCGGALDLDNDDIITKMREYMKISIPSDFCDTHEFTMDSNADRILEFYKKVMNQDHSSLKRL